MRPSSKSRAQPRREPDPAAVLTKAVLRAASLLGLNNVAVAAVLGVSEASVSRLSAGARFIDPESKEGELALLLVRVYRSLDVLVGADEDARMAWLTSHNDALNARPVDLLARVTGLAVVVAYLDAMRAPA